MTCASLPLGMEWLAARVEPKNRPDVREDGIIAEEPLTPDCATRSGI
jgi:hypothetical protein